MAKKGLKSKRYIFYDNNNDTYYINTRIFSFLFCPIRIYILKKSLSPNIIKRYKIDKINKIIEGSIVHKILLELIKYIIDNNDIELLDILYLSYDKEKAYTFLKDIIYKSFEYKQFKDVNIINEYKIKLIFDNIYNNYIKNQRLYNLINNIITYRDIYGKNKIYIERSFNYNIPLTKDNISINVNIKIRPDIVIYKQDKYIKVIEIKKTGKDNFVRYITKIQTILYRFTLDNIYTNKSNQTYVFIFNTENGQYIDIYNDYDFDIITNDIIYEYIKDFIYLYHSYNSFIDKFLNEYVKLIRKYKRYFNFKLLCMHCEYNNTCPLYDNVIYKFKNVNIINDLTSFTNRIIASENNTIMEMLIYIQT